MTIAVDIVILEQPYGNPGSLGEPLGLWYGEANVQGDGTGGFVAVQFVPRNAQTTPTLPDARRQYVYFCDGALATSFGTVSPGDISVQYGTHWARANASLTERFRHIFAAQVLQISTSFIPRTPIFQAYVSRLPMFWTDRELILGSLIDLVTIRYETNDALNIYNARCYGRYYDKQILANRAFGRLVSPPAISQF